MRSFFIYVRTTDNQFFSGALALDLEQSHLWGARVIEYFKKLGNPLPPPQYIVYVRYLADPRNELDMAGYAEVELDRATRPPTPAAGDSYCVVSEYEPGVTTVH